jgi:hypothetical protein
MPYRAAFITETSDFLLRTEGVALLTAALLLWAVRDAGPVILRPALLALALYLLLGSLVDSEAYSRSIVGPASLPSAAVRIALGIVSLVAAVRLRRASR